MEQELELRKEGTDTVQQYDIVSWGCERAKDRCCRQRAEKEFTTRKAGHSADDDIVTWRPCGCARNLAPWPRVRRDRQSCVAPRTQRPTVKHRPRCTAMNDNNSTILSLSSLLRILLPAPPAVCPAFRQECCVVCTREVSHFTNWHSPAKRAVRSNRSSFPPTR